MQHRERVLGHVEYSQKRLRARRAELLFHLRVLNRSRRNLKTNPFLHYMLGYTRVARNTLCEVRDLRRKLAVIADSKRKLQRGHDPHAIIESMATQLPQPSPIIGRLRLAAHGLI